MKQYEVTFIVDPVLSDDEIKSTAKTYTDMLQQEGCTIVHVDEMGLRQLAYPIKKRTSGVYFCIEFQTQRGELIPKLELALQRDERIMRFLTALLDKYGVKYNDDKRKGLIGKRKPAKEKKEEETASSSRHDRPRREHRPDAPVKDAPVKEAPVKEAPVNEAAANPQEESAPAAENPVIE